MGTPQDTSPKAQWQGKCPCPVSPGANKNATDLDGRRAHVVMRGNPGAGAAGNKGKGKWGAQRRGERKRERNRGTAVRTKLFDTMQ